MDGVGSSASLRRWAYVTWVPGTVTVGKSSTLDILTSDA